MLTPKVIRLVLATGLLISLLTVLAMTHQVSMSDASASTQEEKQERQLENQIPKHVPLGIKIRKEKEKEFKDLNNEKWAYDFELEVTNTGDRPIYEFYLLLVLDVKDSTGQNVLSSVNYGRTELGDHRVKATPDDVPVKPGESVGLKIHPGQLGAWDIIRRKEGRAHPRKISVKLEGLSFGDGTGLMGNDGRAVPRKPGDPPNSRCGPQQIQRGPERPDWSFAPLRRSLNMKDPSLPATFLPVKFLLAGSAKLLSFAMNMLDRTRTEAYDSHRYLAPYPASPDVR